MAKTFTSVGVTRTALKPTIVTQTNIGKPKTVIQPTPTRIAAVSTKTNPNRPTAKSTVLSDAFLNSPVLKAAAKSQGAAVKRAIDAKSPKDAGTVAGATRKAAGR